LLWKRNRLKMAASSDGPPTTPLIPVSWGEFFDKISILEIKKENVLNGSAKNNIVEELELLTNLLSDNILNDTQLGSGLITRIGRWPRERLQT